MNNLFLIRAEVSLRHFASWSAQQNIGDPDFAGHRILVESFGKRQDGAFSVWRMKSGLHSNQGTIWAYSSMDADQLRSLQDVHADPLQTLAIPPEGIRSKPIHNRWVKGQQLGFEIRTRPIQRYKNIDQTRYQELDVFLLADSDDRQAIYCDWLEKRFHNASGAVVTKAMLASYRHQYSERKQFGPPVTGPDATMRGNLTITDPDNFHNLLPHGLGRHRAYGYGMIFLRHPH